MGFPQREAREGGSPVSVRVRGSRDNLTAAELTAGIGGRGCFRLMDREGSREPQARVKSGHEKMRVVRGVSGCLRQYKLTLIQPVLASLLIAQLRMNGKISFALTAAMGVCHCTSLGR